MFPFFFIFWKIPVYTFWIAVMICFFMFIWMLRKLSIRFSFDFIIFRKNILWFFLSTFFFSRFFYVMSRWNELKHIKKPVEFFVMSDYNFSLMWAIFGFFLVFFILLKVRKEKLDNFISGIVLSLLFVFPMWYIWALLWWQVYWNETNYWIEIAYSHPFTPVPFQVPVFPLPIVYAILFFILFSVLYIFTMHEKNYRIILAYLWVMVTTCILFIFEFFSWKLDFFKDHISLNLTQIFSIIIFVFCAYKAFKIYKTKDNEQV